MKQVTIGVDIGGTNVKLGLVDRRGRILAKDSFETKYFSGKKKLLAALIARLQKLKRRALRNHWRVEGIGIGAPGPIDVDKGFVYFFPNIPGWKNTALKKIVQLRLGLATFVDNDANAMALAEYRFGAGRGAKNIIALTLGTGVGGGMILDGRLFHGPAYSAAEIGHLIINEDGPRCSCGNRGCLEAYVGNGYFIQALQRQLKKTRWSLLKKWIREGRPLTPELAAKAAKKNDALSKRMWRETGAHLGTALAGLANILNPERIIIGGGIARSGELIFRPIRESLKKKAFPIAARSVKVLPAKLGVDSGLIGAASLAFIR
jgi:glucokinase